MLQEIVLYFKSNSFLFWGYVIQHIEISLKVLILAFIIGFPIGAVSFRNRFFSTLVQNSSQLFRIIPSLAVLFFLIPLVGVGEIPALIALTFLAIPPIVVNTLLGFQAVPLIIKEVARGLGMRPKDLFFKIELPLAAPYVLNGLKLALVEILASATLATYIGAGGLGTLIFTGLGLYRMDLLIIGGSTVTVLSLLTLGIFDLVIRKVRSSNV
ncbi:ABC transporter permease subunit [Erwinia sp. CPCC 100877]|nr:ABC transporter permease subunit [Erwinia sp. CPCC 100877]